jgi:NADH pyrophosphatase NudC (nudix superfamily)
MDLGSMFFVLAIALAVGLFVSRPLLMTDNTMVKNGSTAPSDKGLRSQLNIDLEHGLNAIQELDTDHALGKLQEDDYSQQRAELAQAGADVLRQLDVLGPDPEEAAPVKALVAEKETSSITNPAIEHDEIEALIAARRRARQEKISGYCPRCGKPLTPSDQFCPRCGKPVNNEG